MPSEVLSRIVLLAVVLGLASANLVRLAPRTEYVYDYTAQSRLGNVALLVTKAKVRSVVGSPSNMYLPIQCSKCHLRMEARAGKM
ncbi:Hypp2287 [Branchiostoma lanceolatum]|uniref:Hypp2287 protein n=1 Tax=Branchiostoma lanceolatum TaxID=7740 RepID=A0A8J9ZPS7_BRALA|nr:Hypp2287 [Branchiostoma lanceolatum]